MALPTSNGLLTAQKPGLLDAAIALAHQAGEAIMRHYKSSAVSVQVKNDGSPLTNADQEAHQLLVAGLKSSTPDIPCISEESQMPDYSVRSDWAHFWLLDPLDGTKEFLNRNGEFTVNLALIERGEPTLGVIHAPVLDLLYFARYGTGAWKQEGDSAPVRIYSKSFHPRNPVVVVESRSHPSPELEDFLKNYHIKERIKMGSSLKFCLIAEGRADLYPRLGPTMEWDIAAGDCIYRDSAKEGRHETGLRYNQPTMRCQSFVIGPPHAFTAVGT